MKDESQAGKKNTGVDVPPNVATDGVCVFPVTFAQEYLLCLEQQLKPMSAAKSITWSIKLSGNLQLYALDCSLNEIVRRHEILRTTFKLTNGQPAQIVSPEFHIPLIAADLSGSLAPEQDAQEAVIEEAQTPVDVTTGPVIRTKLLRLAATEHVLVLTTHRIVFDISSRRIFICELASLYESFCIGQRSSLPELPVQYGDYAVWQRKYLQGERLDRLARYWREQLAGAYRTLDLPLDRPRSEGQSSHVEFRSFIIPRLLHEQVIRTSRLTGVTPFMTLFAALQVLLSRYSGKDDIVVATPVTNRNYAEIENLIGQFSNVLALRIKLDGDPTYGELLERVKESLLGAYAHQDMPFERLVNELWPEWQRNHAPLFQVLFSLQNISGSDAKAADLQIKLRGWAGGNTVRSDISVFLLEDERSLSGRVEYNANVLDAATIDRMLQQYLCLLQAALDDPATRIFDLPLRVFGDSKVNRRALTAARVSFDHRNKPVPPRNELEATLLKSWQKVLGLDSIGVTDNFFDIGGHSLLAIRLIAEIQNTTGRQLPVSALFEGASVEYLACRLTQMDQVSDELIAEIQGGNARPPFFGIVAPSANALGYVALSRHLGQDQPIYRIQSLMPQPEDGHPYTAIEYDNFAAEYVRAMKTVQPRGPYYLGGMCQGARIAFDMVRLLESRGDEVGLLAIFDTFVIENSRNRILVWVDHYSKRLVQFWRSTRREKSQTLLRGLRFPFRRRGPSKLLVTALWPGRNFVPTKCAARITVFRNRRQPFYYVDDPLLGWGTKTTGIIEAELLDSIHRYTLREPNVRLVAERLANNLDDARRDSNAAPSGKDPPKNW